MLGFRHLPVGHSMQKADVRLIIHGLDTQKSSLLLQTLADGGFTRPVVVDDIDQALGWAITAAAEDPNTTLGLFDGTAVLNANAVEEFTRALLDPAVAEISWLALASDGITLDGELVDNGNYLDHAVTPMARPTTGIHNGAPAIMLLQPASLTTVVSAIRESGEEVVDITTILRHGWEIGLPSFVSGHLRFSVNGEKSGYHSAKGTPSANEWYPSDITVARPDPSITIAIRTTLTRPYLLRRTVASAAVANARRPVEAVVLVGSVDPTELEATAAELRESFPGLHIHALATNPTGASRTANVLAAIDTATTDYIWFIDDDDMATPHSLAAIKNTVHAADRPILFGASEAYIETWASDTRPLLMWSQKTETYDPANVLNAFTGTNSLPICSLIIPVELAQTRLRRELLRHDLGEDFTLLLLLLTMPGVTYGIVDTDIAHISIRPNSDSVVTYEDRTPWLQNLSGFMADLRTDPLASSQTTWMLGGNLFGDSEPDETEPLRSRINQLLADRAELEQALANMRDWAATVQAAPSGRRSRRSVLKRLVPPGLRPFRATGVPENLEMRKLTVYTSANIAYLPKARLLARSLKEVSSEIHFVLGLCDRVPSWLDIEDEDIDEILPIEDLLSEPGWLFRHNVVEFCTALKGPAIKHLLERQDSEYVMYLDPDVYCFQDPTMIIDLMDGASMGLTPHITAPEITARGVIDTEISCLKHGIYNMGFIVVKNDDNGHQFANWWTDRLMDYCRDDIPAGLFTDQRWIDLTPAIFDFVKIIRDDRLNVASWNLEHRKISLRDWVPWSNERPLIFYHFSGTGKGAHEMIRTRYHYDNADLQLFEDQYYEELEIVRLPEGASGDWYFGFYSDGTPIPDAHRRLYWDNPDLTAAFADPFDVREGFKTEAIGRLGNADETITVVEANPELAGDLVDAQFYNTSLGLGLAPDQVLEHFANNGWKWGAWPNPYFNTTFYLGQGPAIGKEIAAAGVSSPIHHFVATGQAQGLQPVPLFDETWYRATYPDVSAGNQRRLRPLGLRALRPFRIEGDPRSKRGLL